MCVCVAVSMFRSVRLSVFVFVRPLDGMLLCARLRARALMHVRVPECAFALTLHVFSMCARENVCERRATCVRMCVKSVCMRASVR